jgi:proteasome lid subunit RPN8/RPN11
MPTDTSPPFPEPAKDVRRMDPASLQERPFEGKDQEYRIVLFPAACEAMLAHGRTNVEVELCGVLVGKVYRDQDGPYLVVADAIQAREAREESSQVTFTYSSWDHIHREMDEKHPDQSIVGWYHMHPGYGVFLSAADRFVHRHFFDAAWQVAAVIDPKSEQIGLFFREEGEIVRARRYWVGERPCWEPAQRPPTSVPPGTGHGKPSEARVRPAAAAGEDPTAAEPLGWGLSPVPLLLALCLLLGAWGLYAALTSTWQAGRLEDLRRAVLDKERSESAELARQMGSWARQRLEQGIAPLRLVPVYVEIVRLDPARRDAYQQYLPELAEIAAKIAKAEAEKKAAEEAAKAAAERKAKEEAAQGEAATTDSGGT